MHLLIPCAGVLSPAGLQATRSLTLPHLRQLLGMMTAVPRDDGDEFTRIPPHERALARLLGLWHDGTWPQAAWLARADGIAPGTQAWGLLTPAHQHVGTEQVTLLDPELLALDADASRTLFEAMRELFESEGARLVWGAPLRWYVSHPHLAGLATTSLDRVIGRNIDAWLPEQAAGRLVRRLLMEVQMTLHAHPLNDAREAAGQLAVNTCWLSGCGALPGDDGATPAAAAAMPTQVDTLKGPTLQEDWAQWTSAWQALDATLLQDALAAARRGDALSLTLCGERHAQRFDAVPRGWLQRLTRRWQRIDVSAVLEAL